ncbi:MAG: hypothetical protein AAF830_12200 [Pseudomonadota bacterium]
MFSFVQLTRFEYEEPKILNLVIVASNGSATSCAEFYLSPDGLRSIGAEIEKSVVHGPGRHRVFEYGTDIPHSRFVSYLLLQTVKEREMHSFHFQKRPCAGLRIRMDNNGNPDPDCTEYQLTDFTIRTTPDRLMALAGMVSRFAELKDNRLYWDESCELLDTKSFVPSTRGGSMLRQSLALLPA